MKFNKFLAVATPFVFVFEQVLLAIDTSREGQIISSDIWLMLAALLFSLMVISGYRLWFSSSAR